MEQSTALRHLAWATAMLMVAVIFAGCKQPAPEPSDKQQAEETAKPDTEPEAKPDTQLAAKPDVEPEVPSSLERPLEEPPLEPPVEEPPLEPPVEEPPLGPEPEKTPDLGPPLVDNPEGLKRLDPLKPVWVDQTAGRVVMVGQVCQTDVPLELFACLRNTKEHEAIVTVDVEAFKVHAGLLAVGAEPGHPVKFDPEYAPAQGTEIEVTVAYKDTNGQTQTARAQDWILDVETKQAMAHPWVFAGSMFFEDEQTGEKYYQAEGGDFICVSNFSSAMLDLPIESSQANSALMFKAFTERIPPIGTPVTLVLRPKLAEAGKEE